MARFVDQMRRTVLLDNTPQRIVSLVPSQTELLYDLGLGDRVVGITKFCIHPEAWYRSKDRVGGTKKVNIDRVKELKPDLIIGNKEENTSQDIQELEGIAPVWMSDIFDLKDAFNMISAIGEMTDRQKESELLVSEINQVFKRLIKLKDHRTALYLIWKDPFMGVAKDTFIDHILSDQLGFKNILNDTRYPQIDLDQIEEPDVIFLSSEPFPFNESHVEAMKISFPNSKIALVDGEYFSWYGSRLKNAPAYFQKLLESLELH
tara:strand:+ start:50903 stop:51688 length:786 start_codon:yes stop_codon:yes gene_type:complete